MHGKAGSRRRGRLAWLERLAHLDADLARGVRARVSPDVASIASRFERQFAQARAMAAAEPDAAYRLMCDTLLELAQELSGLARRFDQERPGRAA